MSHTNAATNSMNRATAEVGSEKSVEVSAREELSALKAGLDREQARQRAKYSGWKPLPIWYTVWALLIGFYSVKALFAGEITAFLVCALITGLICLYVKYLYEGGMHRVWFFVF